MKICEVEGCENKVLARGYCSRHYDVFRKRGDFGSEMCSIDGCTKVVHGFGFCKRHCKLFKKYGYVPERTIFDKNKYIFLENHVEIELYNNDCDCIAVCLIDLEDYEKCSKYKWCLKGDSDYVVTNIKRGKSLRLNRFLLNLEDDLNYVDHKNHKTLDNRKCNLRVVTPSQNQMNQTKSITNSSGIKGVSWNKQRKKWETYITKDRKTIKLGFYDNLEDAAKIRKSAEIELFGEYSYEESVVV